MVLGNLLLLVLNPPMAPVFAVPFALIAPIMRVMRRRAT